MDSTEKYRNIEIISRDPTLDELKFMNLTPFRPTYMPMESRPFTAFKNFGMCSTLPQGYRDTFIMWNGVDDGLVLRFSLDGFMLEIRGPPGTTDLFQLAPSNNQSNTYQRINILPSRINIFKFHGNGSKHYPQQTTPFMDFHLQSHCIDLLFLKQMKDRGNITCHRKYVNILEYAKGKKSDWTEIGDYGCKWGNKKPFRAIDCGCKPTGWTWNNTLIKTSYEVRARVEKLCEPRPISAELVIEKSTVGEKNSGKYCTVFMYDKHTNIGPCTHIVLRMNNMRVFTTTQLRAMGPVDFLSQIGGIMGLLVGASLITLMELFEFTFQSCFRCFKSILRRRRKMRRIHPVLA